jgi:vitamin B12 transporter
MLSSLLYSTKPLPFGWEGITTRRKPGDLPFCFNIKLSGKKVLKFIILNKIVVVLAFIVCPFLIFGQENTIQLNEVIVSDLYAKKSRNSIVKKELKDSLQHIKSPTIAGSLQNISSAYIKENGRGMVASIALRGTTASQTALVWNGININSQLTGQTDLNTINPQLFEQVSLQLGGGSTLYNSGAIGGSIHLDNALQFISKKQIFAQYSFGSFNTSNAILKTKYSNDKLAFNFAYSHQSSDNDYEFVGTSLKNSNGSFYLNSGNLSMAYLLNPENVIKFYANFYTGNRRLSPAIEAISNSKYLDKNFRNLVAWTFNRNNWTSDLKYAFLREEYQFYMDKESTKYTFGNVNQQIIKWDFKYYFTSKLDVTSIITYQNVAGKGSDIRNPKRDIIDYGLLFHYRIKNYSGLELQFKQEKSTDFQSPFLYSIANYFKVNDLYSFKTQISSNYRMPTFNDMYWSIGGNKNLNPENSNQITISNKLNYKSLTLNLNAFYFDINNMIQWLPNSNGQWQPINNESVISKGLEFDTNIKTKINNHILQWNFQYSYTQSSPKNTNLQLIYVPFHKATTSLNYQIKQFTCSFSGSYNGEVFTSTDNVFALKPYYLWNSQINYRYKNTNISFAIENITNQFYQNVLNRPLPGRNFTLQINYQL